MRVGLTIFGVSGQSRLSLGVPNAVIPRLCPCSAGNAKIPDHAIVCKPAAKTAKMCNDVVASAIRLPFGTHKGKM
jgi:hypothetical protein